MPLRVMNVLKPDLQVIQTVQTISMIIKFPTWPVSFQVTAAAAFLCVPWTQLKTTALAETASRGIVVLSMAFSPVTTPARNGYIGKTNMRRPKTFAERGYPLKTNFLCRKSVTMVVETMHKKNDQCIKLNIINFSIGRPKQKSIN
jgi:hypothetical protein